MNETMVTVVGNVATKPVFRETSNGPVVRFRLAATARFFDRGTQDWKDGHTNFFTVWAWRSLAANVASSVSVGEPLLVRGRLKVRSEERGGQSWTSADIEASALGHDLSRGTSAFRRTNRSETYAGPATAAGTSAGTGAGAATAATPSQQPDDEPQFELPPPRPEREPEPAA
ncbi:single-stranded DNA-binding protein [Streptomyces boluensis]|uniref:Single-stranded DNA-binding protein n=1 Tax=Streptomyces boluensis TaxID=1775135 RepID=A0A964UVZ8_9ACTN|nr:single-stranded DNA-binding protein [Streptomyces boluensis]NBE55258.1 single-stranded DNA-binding protein [Streptomyces boluensis]